MVIHGVIITAQIAATPSTPQPDSTIPATPIHSPTISISGSIPMAMDMVTTIRMKAVTSASTSTAFRIMIVPVAQIAMAMVTPTPRALGMRMPAPTNGPTMARSGGIQMGMVMVTIQAMMRQIPTSFPLYRWRQLMKTTMVIPMLGLHYSPIAVTPVGSSSMPVQVLMAMVSHSATDSGVLIQMAMEPRISVTHFHLKRANGRIPMAMVLAMETPPSSSAPLP